MLEINNVSLKSELDALTNFISEYELIQQNIFNQLKDACINWQDGNSIEFENKIYLEKKESELFLQDLKEQKQVIEYIYHKYKELGQNIKCNLNSKMSLLYALENCQNQVNSILSEFYKIDATCPYSEYQMIETQKQKLKKIQQSLLDVISIVTKTYRQIEEIEKEVKNKMNHLEEIKINSFEFLFL